MTFFHFVKDFFSFRNISIKRKLILIILLTSWATLLVASIAFVAMDVITFRQAMVNDISSLAQVVGLNSSGALVFNDSRTAEKNLSALSEKPHVFLACIYDREGRVFATFNPKNKISPPKSPAIGHYIKNNYLYLFHQIFLEEEKIGTILIQSDLAEIRSRIKQSVGIVAIILSVGFLLAMMLSFLLHRVVSEPILSLAQTAKTISHEKDYSIRAVKRSQDEIGTLIDGFNEMLGEIQKRDNELAHYSEHLEEMVADRTAKLKSQQKILKEALSRAEQLAVEAKAANRSKSEFLANMSHEIRTPMNAIIGFTDLLDARIMDKKQKNYLESIRSSGKNLLILINDILDLSKIEAGNMDLNLEPINPHSMFAEIAHIFSVHISEKCLEFIMEIAPDIPESLILDEVRLRQVLFNLVGNAIKFTQEGYIKLSVRKNSKKHDKSSIDLVISVEDTGIGIASESQEKIFESFKQQDGQSTKKYGGTGLGLAISKRLVEMMGGTICVESRVNKGSIFKIILNDVSIGATIVKPLEKKTFDYKKISFETAIMLVVEDIPVNRKLIKEYLQDTNIHIIEAEDGEQAISLAKQHEPDIILMDIRMPVMDGCEATRYIKKDDALKKIPVIALTASGMKEDKTKIMESGFDGFLMKPVQISDLFSELTLFLKYTKEEDDKELIEKVEEGQLGALPPRTIKKIPKIIEELENELMKSWEKVRNNGLFDDIGSFGNLIKRMGDRYSLRMLQKFGDDLIGYVENFDIDNMSATLDSYPELIKRIKESYKELI